MSSGWYVIAGGVCSGKTSVIAELEKRGYQVVPETARELIDEGMQEGKSLEDARGDVLSFQRRVIKRQQEKEVLLPKDRVVFFDRANPDARAFLAFSGIKEPEDVAAELSVCSYKKVFMLEPIRFESDYYRVETTDDIERLHLEHVTAYKSLGFEIVDVPVMPVADRVDFILEQLD
ncbi:MAG TPA: AAA family ATPase [Candidatus Paceibacterota bacterium]|nr:AAA family ATPase [Candidatus Paceibacterota bacterium]